ncbi:TPA: hypothetical protein DIC39_00095 [Patescibacteria group bacterium]|nr:hypothetical protein [Patescibacteria group bacterium]HCU47455.1 hypothetical protein [Patescibacteria group bacterium]
MEVTDEVRKSLIKISEGKAHVPACQALGLGLLASAAVVATIFVLLYTEISIKVVNYDGGGTFSIALFLILLSGAIGFRWRRNQEYKRLGEGAEELHDAVRTHLLKPIHHPTQEVKT